ncbi:hypothetical protein LIN78_12195 [Leeia sp. TBRC 13508]|uniref:Jacalin-type lectin domain-containing protein n=1 Tax=Leeia speluncae TaxID=2884804 RepID=A0ABS8D7W7_9NEIS|nr:jacalin-like lectin [Leeia speluncae]MCB6184306.1 hypothetical protein [Leeia speluncae]
MQNAVEVFENAVPADALKLLIDSPLAALNFAQRIDNIGMTENDVSKISSITTQQWQDIITRAIANEDIKRIATNLNNSSRLTLSDDEEATIKNVVVDILVQLGLWSGLVISGVIAIVGIIGAVAGLIAALTASTIVVATVVAAVASLIVAILAVLALIGLIIAIIVYYLPSDIALSVGTPMFGGGGGSPFADDVTNMTSIKRIKIRHSSFVLSIQTDWLDASGNEVKGSLHGGGWTDGKEDMFELEADEYITKVAGRYGAYIDRISFFTNKGRVFGPYGGSGGTDEFVLQPKYGKKILGFQGRAASAIDALGIRSEIYGSGHGGNGGVPFLDYSSDAPKILKITLRGGIYVDSIQIDRKDSSNNPVPGKRYGGSGGTKEVSLTLEEGERITKITGRAGDYINKLRIETSKNNFIECGENGGEPFEIPLNGKFVTGFWGRSDVYLDKIGICGLI